MKNIFLIAAAIAGLATTAITVSCNKTETSHEQPAFEGKSINLAPLPFTPCFYWWDPTAYDNCIEYKVSDSLCYMGVFPIDYYEDTYLAHLNGSTFESIEIRNYAHASIDKKIRQYLDGCLDRGNIVFKYDCPITCQQLISMTGTNYIPAGKYPIFRMGKSVYIRLVK